MKAKDIIAKAKAEGRNAKNRGVVCDQTSEKWASVREAAAELGVNKYQLYAVLNGTTKNLCGLTFHYGTF